MKKLNIIKYSAIICLMHLSVCTLSAQVFSGKVVNEYGEPLSGTMVSLYNNPSVFDITDNDGNFSIAAEAGESIEINYGDFRVQKVELNNDIKLYKLTDKDNILNLGNSKTSLNRNTQSISIIGSSDLEKNSSTNVGDALYGLLPGLSVMQNVEWNSNPSMYVRGGSPLIVVDGVPRAMETLNITEVESITVLKDAAATALWGARGANGVLLLTTKRGIYNTKSINVDYKVGMGVPINQPDFADAHTYATARNEALFYDGKDAEYSDLEAIKNGTAGYPNVNWQDEAMRNFTTNHQLDFTFRGGGQRLRYFATLGYKNDVGIFNPAYTDMSERYQSQLKQFQFNTRINLDVMLTKSSNLNFSMLGQLFQTNSPSTDLNTIFKDLYNVPSLAFPIKSDQNIWGANTIMQRNPIAQICDVGYKKFDRQLLQSNLRFVQDLSMITSGLSAEVMATYDMSATYRNIGTKKYQYQIGDIVYGGGNEVLSIDNKKLDNELKRAYVEAKLAYRKEFGNHNLNTSLMYRYEYTSTMGANNTQKRQYLLGQIGYDYKNVYLLDLIINHYGTSYLQSGGYYRTYPAVAVGWVVSNEKFFTSDAVDLLKIRASYGKSGYDAIGYNLDKQYWLYKNSYYFGEGNSSNSGYGEGALALEKLEIQKSIKSNVGFDLGLFNHINISAEVFTEQRRNIMVDGSKIIPSHIGVEVSKLPIGANDYKGLESSIMWKDKLGDFSYYLNANFSFVRSKVIENGEGFLPYSNLSGKGLPVGQIFGLEAIGYFRDQEDINSSLIQNFSNVRPGDIKYRDVNGDKIIDDNDKIAIGYNSSVPEMYFGFSIGAKYKNFGFDVLFQGASNYSKMLNTASVYWPLRNNTNISKWYLNDKIRWTEETKDFANVPRLTTENNENNFRASTQWLADASFLKLRNVNIYYNLPQEWVKMAKMENVQFYLRGNNLLSFDKIKYLNCEDLSIGYPDLMSLYLGVNIKF